MMSQIPFVIGVTGHRDLRIEDFSELRRLVKDQFTVWMHLCPNTEFFLMTSLAEGADQLSGRIASDMGLKLLVPLPMESIEYEKDFSAEGLDEYHKLLNQSFSAFVVPDTEMRSDGSREYGYRQAGIYIAKHCHVLLALWDGQKRKEGCCGTAETVDFKLHQSYGTQDSRLKIPMEGIVLQILTPRARNEFIPRDALTAQLIETIDGTLRDLLKSTDTFNKDASELKTLKSKGIFREEESQRLGQSVESIQKTYKYADTLALCFRDRYLALLKWMSLTGAMLVLAFLFYDELEANLFLICFGLIALVAYAMFFVARQRQYHRKYIEYRLFAETLRVQANLLAAGFDMNVADLMPWSFKMKSPWILQALRTYSHGTICAPAAAVDVRDIWIQDQLNYQKLSNNRKRKKLQIQSKISSALIGATILFFLIVLATEFLLPSWIGTQIKLPDWFYRLTMSHSEQFLFVRGVMKILLGIIPALTLVVSSYYGKLSLERNIKDGQRMIELYSQALINYDNPLSDKDKLLKELAREELLETGDWYSYVSENRPDFLI